LRLATRHKAQGTKTKHNNWTCCSFCTRKFEISPVAVLVVYLLFLCSPSA
jgi:hypothetical protein